MTEQIFASLATIAKNFNNTSDVSLAIVAGLGLLVGGLLTTLGSRVTRLTTMDANTKEQADYGYLLPLGKCWSCGSTLPLWQQIPLLSFVFLRRKCHYCSAEISWRYPLIEGLTAALLLVCLLRWAELKIGFGYFVFFSGIIVALSIVLRGVILPTHVTFVLCLLGLMASALEFGQLAPKDAISGAMLGYIIPFVYNRTNAKMNPHLERIPEAYLLFYASIGAWLGPVVAVEMLLCAIAIMLIFRLMLKPHPLTFGYQLTIIGLASFVRIVLGQSLV